MQTTSLHVLPWYKQRWPWLLLSGPAIVVVAGFFTAWLAFSGSDPLVVDEYYKEGKAINQELKRDQAATALGLRMHVIWEGQKFMGLRLNADSEKTLGNRLIVYLIHPTQKEKDLSFEVLRSPLNESLYQPQFPLLLEPGKWYLTLEDPQKEWRLKDTVVIAR